MADVVESAWQELCERDDRTSPEDYPDMCLITQQELAEFMSRAALSQAGAGGGVVARDFAGCCEPHDDVERTISIVRAAYDWQVSTDGILCGLVAGDMGYASTHIQLNLNELPNATPPATPVQPTASVEAMAWRDVIAERHRQVEDEGWVPEHDDEHSRGEMARAAACYADPVNIERETPPARWPWDEQWWKPAGQRRMLVKAGALIIAEIERLDRKNGLASLTPAPTQGVIDLDKADWDALLKAAAESSWMPPEYTRNHWISDLCLFLREGAEAFATPSPAPVSAPSPAGGVREALDVPMGAIENGRAFADRLEATGLECLAGDLRMCSDWQEFRRCFDWLAEWAVSIPTRVAIERLDASLAGAAEAIQARNQAAPIKALTVCRATLPHMGGSAMATDSHLREIDAALSSPATPEPVAFDPLNGGCPHCKWLDTNLGRVLDQKCDLHQKIEDMQSDSALDRGIIKEQAGLIRRICEVIGADDDDDPVERAKERMDEIAELEAATPEPISAPANGEVDEIARWKRDSELLSAIESECWDVRFTDSPNADAGDYNISIEIVGHFMAEPRERVVGENYSENLRAALEQAMTADAYPPARPTYDEPDETEEAALSNPAPGHGEGGL